MSHIFKGSLLTALIVFASIAQTQQVKNVLTDTPEIRNNKVEQTLQRDTLPPSDIFDLEKYFHNLPPEDKSRILCQLPEKAQGSVNVVDAHEKGHAFDLNHTFKGTTIPVQGLMANGQGDTGLNKFIAENHGEYMPSEQNAELVAFLLEQGVFKLDTLTNINNEIFNQKFQLYPNPAHDIIHIRTMEDIKISSVIITDVMGRKVKEINNAAAIYTWDGQIQLHDIRSYLNPGIYIISIKIDQGIVNKKVIIQ